MPWFGIADIVLLFPGITNKDICFSKTDISASADA
jgi:hypothetical protein